MMTPFELRLKELPIRQPSPGYIDRVLAERPRPTRREPNRWLDRRRVRFALPVAAALAVACLCAVFYWPPGETGREVAEAPVPIDRDLDLTSSSNAEVKLPENRPAVPAVPAIADDRQDGPAIAFDLQKDQVDGQIVAERAPDIPRPSLKMAERVFRHPAFSEGLAALAGPLPPGATPIGKGLDSALGYIDTDGLFVIPPKFRRAEDFQGGIARVRDRDDQPYYYIDHHGRRVSEELVVEQPEPILKVVRRDHKCGYVDTRTGKFVIEPAYDDAYPFREGRALVVKDRKRGYIDTKGKVVIPIKYRAAGHFSEGLAPVRLSVEQAKAAGSQWADTGWTPWGYIDRTGKMVLPAQYSTAQPFSEGLAYVSEYYMTPDGFRGFINHRGTHVLDVRSVSDIENVAPARMPVPKEF